MNVKTTTFNYKHTQVHKFFQNIKKEKVDVLFSLFYYFFKIQYIQLFC